jgi:alkylation response protein AidB-like acyl-CoA dehydrogenase
MDLTYTPDEEAFRAEVRAFLDMKLPHDIREKVRLGKRLCKDDFMRWQKILHDRGWGAGRWPRPFGGAGWTVVQDHIFEEERATAGAPPQIAFALRMIGPVLMAFGNPWQQGYFLPKIVAGEHFWCQGFSEPGSGSDLASLRTEALREGDHYIVSGQKTWNTAGHLADWIFCLVRTSSVGAPQHGISFILIDMQSPGITVRPITMLDGEREINEIWFDKVRVPVKNLVGEENKGWTYAKFLLTHERTNNAGIGMCKRGLRKLKEIAADQLAGGRPLIENERFRDRIARVELELMALEITNLRMLSAAAHEQRPPGPEASLLKIKGSELIQQLAELQMYALGHDALPYLHEAFEVGWAAEPLLAEHYRPDAPPVSAQYFNLRKTTIFAGSNEIQRNIIAKLILGL